VRERTLIHVGGPTGSGKTALVEAIVAAADGPVLAVRCVRDHRRRLARESSPRTHAELRRYLQAGAYAASVFAFPGQVADAISFYETDLMLNYSEVVILEGDNPLEYADLEVFVAPVPDAGETLFVRRQRDVAAAQRARVDAWERLLSQPDGMATWMGEVMGIPVGELLRKKPELGNDVRTKMLAGIAAARKAPPARAVEHWAVSERFQGIERAGLVVVNIRDQSERASAEQLVADVHRLRKDDALFDDIVGWRGHRLPITAVVANLVDPGDAGRKKGVGRVRRTIRQGRIAPNPGRV
jgi:hypothetical protein